MPQLTPQDRHAYLVMAHNEPEVLAILLSMLDDPRNDIYLHIDRRAVELRRQFDTWHPRHSRLFLLDDPEAVYWGDISQVKAELKLFEAAQLNGPYAVSYTHLTLPTT